MATPSYPKLGSAAWRTLRERAAAAPSTKFTAATVAAILSMGSPQSAAANIVGPMQRLGLIDNDGTLTALGNKWRVDASYGEACQEILDEIYPPELASFTDANGGPDRSQVTTWFQHKGFGGSNSRQMAATYVMIAEKNAPGGPAAEPKKTTRSAPARKAAQRAAKLSVDGEGAPKPSRPPQPPGNQPAVGPNIHLDIQIHIPADASVEQIDQIFASMAKHLYQK
jgi:hypothetical protein